MLKLKTGVDISYALLGGADWLTTCRLAQST
jgi:hypothetical protein